MATRLEDEFDPTRINAPDAAYPAGSLKDETTPGVSDDGTPLASRVGNDWQGFSQSALDKAGIAANGQPDSVSNPQILQSIEKMYNDGDSQLSGGNIWPLSSQESAQIGDIVSDIEFIRINNVSSIEQFALISKDGTTQVATGNIDSIDASFNPIPSVTIGGVEYWCRIYKYYDRSSLSIRQFGAIETTDGSFDNTPSFIAIRECIIGRGGYTKLVFEPNEIDNGYYYYDQWKDVGDASFYGQSDIFELNDLFGIFIQGNNARVKCVDGIRFGSFDQNTGVPTAGISTDPNERNGHGDFFQFTNSKVIKVQDLEIDGNSPNFVVGGFWGDTGYQIQGTAVRTRLESRNVHLKNIKANNMGTDGFAWGLTTDDGNQRQDFSMTDCVAIGNGRQGLSHTGGNFGVFTNCIFGRSARGTISSQPRAGIDIEAESNRYIVGNVFTGCVSYDNAGAGVVCDSGSIRVYNNTFDGCTIQGTDITPLFFNVTSTDTQQKARFTNCDILGSISVLQNISIENSTITDTPNEQFPVVHSSGFLLESSNEYTEIAGCEISVTKDRLGFNLRGLRDNKVYFRYDQDTIDYSSGIGTWSPNGSRFKTGNNTFIDNMVGTNTDVWWFSTSVPIDNSDRRYAIDRNTGNQIPWRGTDDAPIRKFANLSQGGFSKLNLSNNGSSSPDFGGDGNVSMEALTTVPPTSGTYYRGEILIKYIVPGNGTSFAEVCSTTGDAGVTAVFKPVMNVNQTP